jgi:hypothetical protein
VSVVNLNKARKARVRSDAKARSNENAAKFGRTKSEKTRDAAVKRQAASKVDQHKRER